MNNVKRIEIVLESVHDDTVVRMIRQAGIDGFTMLRGVAGSGNRGGRDADGLPDVFQNVCFIIAAEADACDRLLEMLRPLLNESGGMCLVSDAKWLKH